MVERLLKNNTLRTPKCHFANTKNVFARNNNEDIMFDKVFGVRTVFAKQRKRSYIFDVTPWFSVWTSQGLNLGPPDYESVALTN